MICGEKNQKYNLTTQLRGNQLKYGKKAVHIRMFMTNGSLKKKQTDGVTVDEQLTSSLQARKAGTVEKRLQNAVRQSERVCSAESSLKENIILLGG